MSQNQESDTLRVGLLRCPLDVFILKYLGRISSGYVLQVTEKKRKFELEIGI